MSGTGGGGALGHVCVAGWARYALAVAGSMLHNAQQCSFFVCVVIAVCSVSSNHLVFSCMYCQGLRYVYCASCIPELRLQPHIGEQTTKMMGLLGALDFSKNPSSCDVVHYMVSIRANKVQFFEQVHALLEIVYGVQLEICLTIR